MKYLFPLFMILAMAGCKNKPSAESEALHGKYFPVLSFLKGQAKIIDTSLYRIVVSETIDTTTKETYIRREDFKNYAKDFLELPDITSGSLKDDYEETQMFDDALNNMILTYTTKDPDHIVKREDVLLEPVNESGNNDVKSIIIHTIEEKGDSTVEKNMVWYVNKRFTVVTKTARKDQPERVVKKEVIWNDFLDNR